VGEKSGIRVFVLLSPGVSCVPPRSNLPGYAPQVWVYGEAESGFDFVRISVVPIVAPRRSKLPGFAPKV